MSESDGRKYLTSKRPSSYVSHNLEFKLKAIKLSEESSITEVAKQLGVHRASIRDWKRKRLELEKFAEEETNQRKRLKGGGRKKNGRALHGEYFKLTPEVRTMKMEETIDNRVSISRLSADAVVNMVCEICSRNCDGADGQYESFANISESNSQQIFTSCSKYLKAERFWRHFEWGSILNQGAPVCRYCYTSASDLFRMLEEMKNLTKNINNLKHQFTNEVIKYRDKNQKTEIENGNESLISSDADRNSNYNTEDSTGTHVDATYPLKLENCNEGVSVKPEPVEDWNDENEILDEQAFANEISDADDDNSGGILLPSLASTEIPIPTSNRQSNLYVFTNSSGVSDAVHLKDFRIELQSMPELQHHETLDNQKTFSLKSRTKPKGRLNNQVKISKKNVDKGHKVKCQSDKPTNPPIYVYKCTICETSSENNLEMQDHVKIHQSETVTEEQTKDMILKLRKCTICSTVCNSRKGFWYHNQSHELKDGIICIICGVKLLNKQTLRQHLQIHSLNSLKCHLCDWECKTKILLQRHIIMAHTEDMPFKCPQCPKKFKLKVHLCMHIKRHEKRITRPYSCTVCGKTYTDTTPLKYHMKIHSGDLLKCDFGDASCTRMFPTVAARSLHIKYVHTKEVSFFCEICGQTMKSKLSLDCHRRKHTGEKPFQCNTCGKHFLRKQYLEEHSKTHTGETFSCHICSRSILNKSNFRKHMRMHENKIARD